MKTTKSIFYLIIILSLYSCKSESINEPVYHPFPTTNAYWTLTHCEFSFFPKTAFVKVGVFGDTIIRGRTYYKLYAQSNWKRGLSCSDCNFNFSKDQASYFTSFREENKKIYIVPSQPIGSDPLGSEYIIYDFNIKKVGDAVQVYPFFFQPVGSVDHPNPPAGWGNLANDSPIEYKVKEIREVRMSDGSMRNAYLFDDTILEAWVEGMGTTHGFASFHHVYDISDNTLGFSSNGVHLLDIRNLDITYMGDCGIDPFSYELTVKR